MGPGPGEHGGRVVFEGTPADLAVRSDTLTAQYLSGRRDAGTAAGRRGPPPPDGPAVRVRGATEHNLKDLDVDFPLHRLVCVTGVSGSGKSTLVQDVLYGGLKRAKGKPTETPGAHREILGAELVGDVVLVDQRGNLYVSGPGGLWIISPAGKHLGTVIPPKHPHNFAWGGDDGKTLYMTARNAIYRMNFNIPGVRP